jgi:hypothetical protein
MGVGPCGHENMNSFWLALFGRLRRVLFDRSLVCVQFKQRAEGMEQGVRLRHVTFGQFLNLGGVPIAVASGHDLDYVLIEFLVLNPGWWATGSASTDRR